MVWYRADLIRYHVSWKTSSTDSLSLILKQIMHIVGAAAMAGSNITGEVYVWVVVFLLPVNSAINPLLYTVSSLQNTNCCKVGSDTFISWNSITIKPSLELFPNEFPFTFWAVWCIPFLSDFEQKKDRVVSEARSTMVTGTDFTGCKCPSLHLTN